MSKLLIPESASGVYQTAQDEGSPLAQRSTLNFVGAGVTATDSGGVTTVTIPGGGGGGETLAATYALGVNQANSTFALDATRLGLKITDNATPISGGLLSVQNAGGPVVTFFEVGATQSQLLKSGMADGAAAVGTILDTTLTWTNATARLLSVRTQGAELFAVMKDGAVLAPSAGPNTTQKHTLPAVASDTFALLAASQTLASKTLTTPVISAGLSALGSAANDFSASTGTFLTSSGANTLSGDVTISGTKTFATGTGAVAMNGTMTVASGKVITGAAASDLTLNAVSGRKVVVTVNGTDVFRVGGTALEVNQDISIAPSEGIYVSGAGTSAFDFSNGSGIFKTTTGAATLNGSTNTISPASVTTSGARTILTVTGVADTDQTASTEKVDVDFALNRTVTFDQGVKTVQRAVVVRAPTYGISGGEPSGTDDDINDAATFAITGPPIAGTFTQFINGSWSLWSQSGAALFQNDAAGQNVVETLMLENRTAAATGPSNQQYSPALVWSGRGWKTTATAASQTVRYAAMLVPIEGTANPDGALIFYKSINGGAYSQAEVNGNGYFGSNDAQALGTATTSSTTFVDVGNGSSTGFASWTAPATKVTKTYTLHVSVRTYMPTMGTSVTTYFQVLQDGVAISGQPTATASQAFGTTTSYLQTTWRIAVPCTAGSAHVYKLQWKVGNAGDAAGVTATVGTLQYYITG